MAVKTLILLIIFHFSFDWILQDRETARKKSTQYSFLFGHLTWIMIGLLGFAALSGEYTAKQGFIYALLNTLIHGIIDWNIWKVYKLSVIKRFPDVSSAKDFPYYDDGWFYHFIAIDQLLHGLCYIILHVIVKELA